MPQTICKDRSVYIGATAINGNTYSWTSNPSWIFQSISKPSVKPSNSTWYYLTETISTTQCAKTDQVYIKVNQPSNTSLYITSCDKYTFKGNDITQTGIYYDTLININGCDSVVALNLTIYNSTQTNITTLACNSYIFKGNPYTNSGIYYDSLSTSHGCDSVVKLTLTIIKTKIDTIVQTNITCFGDNNGTATVTASGGHAPYTYKNR